MFVFPSADNEAAAITNDARLAARTGSGRPFWAFALNDWHLDLVWDQGMPALGSAYAAQMRAIQGSGPFLLFGTCVGGYFAWETARQLLALGEEVAGLFFCETPIRPGSTEVYPGNPPATTTRNLWRLTHYYLPQALPVSLVHIMTESWHARGWWQPWHDLALASAETVTLPEHGLTTQEFLAPREATIAQRLRVWIDLAERRRTPS